MSIEVLDGAHSADRWADAFGDSLITSALSYGVMDWSWHRQSFGVVLELLWADEADWERFRASTLVQAALDAVPDPVTGLIVYKGRGGSAGRNDPRCIRPLSGSGSAALPLPEVLFEVEEPEVRRVLVGALR